MAPVTRLAVMASNESQSLKYDVVLSFAGEDRGYVEEVAEHLDSAGVSVFYDRYEQVALWGKDLYAHLDDVYRRKGRYCVMFISQAYRDKVWTNHERQSAQARAFEEAAEYILPARFDDIEIPGVLPTTGYVDLQKMSPKELAELILEKLGNGSATETSQSTGAGDTALYRKPKTGRRTFNPYDEALSFISGLVSELKRRCDELAEDDISATVFEREGRRCARFVVDGQTVYTLDVWMGGPGSDSSVQFYGVRGEARAYQGSMNAWGNFVWDKEAGRPLLAFNDMSLLRHFGGEKRLTPEEFTEALWEKVCDTIEEAG